MSLILKKAGTIILCIVTVSVTAPFSSAEVVGSLPIGKLATSGEAFIGGVPAPTGTVVFSDESVATGESPTVITFLQGSSVMLTPGAAATFSRAGKTLVVRADKGIIGFNFAPGEDVNIRAGAYQFIASTGDRANAGELALAADGRVAMSLSSGSFSVLHITSGMRSEVTPTEATELLPPPPSKGSLTKGGNTFTDPNAHWYTDSLKGKTIRVGGETHTIVSNTANTITIDGTWTLNTGAYGYSVAAVGAAATGAAGAGLSVAAKLAIVAAIVGGGTGIGVGIWEATKSAK
jgi:hypothetical protein